MKKRSHNRSDGFTQISLSIPKDVLAEVDAMARADDRSRSQWVVRELKKAVAEAKKDEGETLTSAKVIALLDPKAPPDAAPALKAAEAAEAAGKYKVKAAVKERGKDGVK